MKKLAVALIALVAVGCFTKKKTDAERAAEERKEARAKLEKSLALVPYRGLKITLRSAGAKQVPEALVPLQLLAQQDKDPVKLILALYEGRKALEGIDEDTFPTLAPPLWPGYDAKIEHLCLALFWLTVDTSASPPTGIGQELVMYELDRATVPTPLAYLARGVSYANGGWHYAAEEELTKYLDDLEKAKPVAAAALLHRTPDETLEGGRAIGYFVRAWNRTALGRRDQATDDVEKGLASLEKLGIDNELTQWGWALVHQRRGRYAKSAESLAKLAQSPHLDDEGRAAVRACAEEMKKEGADPGLFSKPKTMMLVARALFARLGGVEKLIIELAGEDKGRAIYAKLAWMDRARHSLGAPVESGKKALDFVKDKITK